MTNSTLPPTEALTPMDRFEVRAPDGVEVREIDTLKRLLDSSPPAAPLEKGSPDV